MPLFGKSSKSSADVVKNLKDAILTLEKNKDTKKQEKAHEEFARQLATTKSLLFESEQQPDIFLAQFSQEVYNSNLLLYLLQNMSRIDFESKKVTVQVFVNVLRREIGSRNPTVEYICTKPEILFILCKGYEQVDIALNCGVMLRDCIRYESLAKIILLSPQFYDFFTYVEEPTFDVASDAFSTFKELLTRHKVLAAEFLVDNYDAFFKRHEKLLHSENYVTRRQSLKLLGEILLDRHYFTVMQRYISKTENLKLMMKMLKENSRNIQFEAFHVFKVFIANPDKPQPIVEILYRNKDLLVNFLNQFQNDRSSEESFNDEKIYLINQIKDLKPPATASKMSS